MVVSSPMSSPPGLSSSVSSSRTASSSFEPATPQRSSRPGGGGLPHHPPSPDLARIASPASSPASSPTTDTPVSRSRSSSFLSLAGLGIGGSSGRSAKGKDRVTLTSAAHPASSSATGISLQSKPFDYGQANTAPATPLLFTSVRSPVPSRPVSPSPSLLTLTRPSTPLSSSVDLGPAFDRPSLSLRPSLSFDDVLPREIKLLIFRSLIDLWIADERRGLARGDRWVGEGAGRRELIKLARVSKSWTTLVLDGSLWPAISTNVFPFPAASPLTSDGLQRAPSVKTPKAVNVLHLAVHAGSFVRSLVLRDIELSSVELRKIGLELAGEAAAPVETLGGPNNGDDGGDGDDELRMSERSGGHDSTGLRTIDLKACRGVAEGALCQLVAKSSHLTTINLSYQPAVTRTLVALLATECPSLTSISLSRCHALTGLDLLPLFADTTSGGTLEKLHLAGLKGMDAKVLLAIGRCSGRLKSLDLSETDVTDSSLAALVEITPDEQPPAGTVSVRWVVAHGDRQERKHARRALFSLHHLNLSGCRSLSDAGVEHLTNTTPALRFLQLAGLGRLSAHLLAREPVNPPPLARLFADLAALQKVDLEDSDATDDDVLRLVASACVRVEHIVLSGCRRITAAGIGHVVAGCRTLKVLEADGTRITDAQVKAFLESVQTSGVTGAALSVLDSQLISRAAIVPLLPLTRPRAGSPGFAFSPFGYQSHVPRSSSEPDSPIGAASPAGRNELDATKPVLSCFWAWGVVDSVRKEVARETRAREAALAAAATAAAAAAVHTTTSLSPKSGKNEQSGAFVAARRTLGWRTASSGSIALLSVPSRPPNQRSLSQPATPLSGRRSDAGRNDDLRGCTIM